MRWGKLLNREIFTSLAEVQVLIEECGRSAIRFDHTVPSDTGHQLLKLNYL